MPLMRAVESTEHICLQSIDICNFLTPHYIGNILELRAKVIYTDPKKGLAYV